MTHPNVATGNAIALANPWSVIPALGNLDAYISAVNRLPMLTLEQEQTYARQLRDENSVSPMICLHIFVNV